MQELDALLLLTNTPGLGAVKLRRLRKHFGAFSAAAQACTDQLSLVSGVGPRLSHAIDTARQSGRWEQDKEMVERYGVDLVMDSDPRYPQRLLEIADAPVLLYVKGMLPEQSCSCVAIVGTRHASIYGRASALRIGEDLARSGLPVVSGLARGIDTAAHEGALKGGSTVAVIGSGLAKLYPRENQELASRIAQDGAVVSEFPMLTPPDRPNFPQRNRIVSGMSCATLVIEAKERSGAMITARKALGQKRLVFALPGRVDSESFSGNHWLMKNGHARLLEKATDVTEALGLNVNVAQPSLDLLPVLSPDEQALWDALPSEEQTVEELARSTELPVAKLNILLMKLLLKKRVKKYPGNVFHKVG